PNEDPTPNCYQAPAVAEGPAPEAPPTVSEVPPAPEAAAVPETPSAPEAPSTPEAPADDLENVSVKETLTQGDCFYSAIFRSSSERGLLEKLAECLNLDASDEETLIKSFRNKLADSISKGNLQNTDERNGNFDTYDYLVSTTGNSGTYQQVTSSYPSWFNREFGNNGENLGMRDSFCQRLASLVKEPGEWVGEIEVRIVTEWLADCNIKLEVRSSIEEKLYKKSQGMDVLHLYNPNEQHFEYFSFEPEGSAAPEGRRVESTNRWSNDNLGLEDKTNKAVEVDISNKDPCNILYDPCSGKPLEENTMKALEKRIREIRNKTDNNSETETFPLVGSFKRFFARNRGIIDLPLPGAPYKRVML
ncbi:MAG: hypothetical protein EB127_31015, partial [Alphaproteobacteria bacterium]|nr:hypothetical protein [Alphaproteobacteria bacterium]